MAGSMSSLPLKQLISTVDTSRLPIILQVCSGIYFQGSVYEMSGSEVCFSTGDLMKVIGLKLVSVTCEDVTSNQKSEMPIEHKGLFKQVPEGRPYQSLEEMLCGRAPGAGDPSLPIFSFYSGCKLTVGTLVVGPGTVMTALSVEPEGESGGWIHCRMRGYQGGSVAVAIPLHSQGEFYECFSLQEIVSSAQLLSGHFCCTEARDGAERPLAFCPVYDVEARMHLRKDTVRFPSSLEVDVVDVTHQQMDTPFIAPFSLDELLPLPDHTFPAMAKILETPKVEHLVCSGWVEELRRHQELVLHSKGSANMVLFCSARRTRRQYFLVSEGYGGRFRRRPREFLSVYEVYTAAIKTPGLRVTVTRPIQETEDVIVGDELEVVGLNTEGQEAQQQPNPDQSADMLVCRRVEELSEDEGDEGVCPWAPETFLLSVHWHGFFREVITNNKKYRLKDLCQQFSPPLDVTVASRDKDLASDPLYGISSLCLEGLTVETVVQASFPTSPELSFTIPTRWLSLAMYFTQNSLPWPQDEPPVSQVETVTEVMESFYLENCSQIYSQMPPPPRPPKTYLSIATPKPSKPEALVDCCPALSVNDSVPEEGLGKLSIDRKAKQSLPLPQIPCVPLRSQTIPHTSSAPLKSVTAQVPLGEDCSEEESSNCMLSPINKLHEYELY
ncbi:hypothetical protein NHX12_002000 [Muraenolepis orangiensis]|uniref:CABIT domain-containing protein n=1 Tax=Muraenolepis orangiensis TaxID=630683 RepID=A0A9Q0DZL4_9TELE|nr:hypothetical protein NHX12_002000 [Muraenolepis orangiensis]